MNPAKFLWMDFRQDTSASGLFHSLVPSYDARELVHPNDITPDIQACQPHFLCFEFDIPLANGLAVLQQAKRHYPSLRVLMITASHSESFAVWALRLGVWDYLVKPLTAGDLNTSIEALAHLCLQQNYSDWRICWPPPWSRSEHPPAEQRIQQGHKTFAAREFLEKHFAEIVRLPAVAGLCHMSESEFSRVFKKEHGHTFCEYLLKFRISKACELLADTSVHVKTVAFEVGFNDLSYFSRTFRRYTGVTPSQYQHVSATDIPVSFNSSQQSAIFSTPI